MLLVRRAGDALLMQLLVSKASYRNVWDQSVSRRSWRRLPWTEVSLLRMISQQ